jgi:hypothetical protein
MPNKPRKTSSKTPVIADEPVAACQRTASEISLSDSWNPNVPFHGTQEEWWEHIHKIEEGQFYTIEEADAEFEIWKNELLASRI